MINEINVIYQFNERYVPYAGVSLTSLLVNNTDAAAINIYILAEGISEASKEKLRKTAEGFGRNIVFPDTAPLLASFAKMGMLPYRGAYSVYLRLFFDRLPELSGIQDGRVLYLDSDTIVEGSLLPLMNHDLGGKTLGMVLESITDDYKVMIGMDRTDDYFNSGVILYDVGRWKEKAYSERLTGHIKNVRSSYIGDQDFINIVCEGDICRLPIIYNFQPLHGRYSASQYFEAYTSEGYYGPSEIEEGKSSAVIYHCYRWLGEFPWHKGNLHPFGDRFDTYLKMSEWKDLVKTKADKGPALAIEKMLYKLLPRCVFIRIFRKAHELMLKGAEKDARIKRASINS